ncbi:Solute carrier organic anion transporter family member 1A1 [Nymphon striatum]|nr:Solute carrier organic anion transporter family member 1A1 [Nymphon striatum]
MAVEDICPIWIAYGNKSHLQGPKSSLCNASVPLHRDLPPYCCPNSEVGSLTCTDFGFSLIFVSDQLLAQLSCSCNFISRPVTIADKNDQDMETIELETSSENCQKWDNKQVDHRPRLMGLGLVISSISSLLIAIPQFLFGSKLYDDVNHKHSIGNETFVESNQLKNIISTNRNEICQEVPLTEQSAIALMLIGVSLFVGNGGYVLYVNLGTTFLDDNAAKRRIPMFLGILGCCKKVGYVMGVFYASAFLMFYQDLSVDPGFDNTDSRWIGAWWLGFILIGIQCFVFGITLCIFPRTMKLQHNENQVLKTVHGYDEKRSFSLHLLSYGLFCFCHIWNIIDDAKNIGNNVQYDCIRINFIYRAIRGFINIVMETRPNKYRNETRSIMQYSSDDLQTLVYVVNVETVPNCFLKRVLYYGINVDRFVFIRYILLVSIALGHIIGGALTSYFKPAPQKLLAFMSVSFFMSALCCIAIVAVKCDATEIKKNIEFKSTSCETMRDCELFPFNPVCDEVNGITYYSECHANCQYFTSSGNSMASTTTIHITFHDKHTGWLYSTSISCMKYYNCGCMVSDGGYQFNVTRNGKCTSRCHTQFLSYVILITVVCLLWSASTIIGILISLRCVEKSEKTFAQGLLLTLMTLIAFIPSPIIYGVLIDNSCSIWKNHNCGGSFCLQYNYNKFYDSIQYISAAGFAIAGIFSMVATYLSKGLQSLVNEEES